MKRYIEIVYDNSGSMNGDIGNKTKYEIAQELFEKEILPTIAIKGDEVVLRLLAEGCRSERSHAESLTAVFGKDRKGMLSRIKTIVHDRSTPLYFTIADSINACKRTVANEHLIFVLTDGDDTCLVNYQELISQADIDKYVKHFKLLLVQFAIDSAKSSNNLTAFTSYLGGHAIALERYDSSSEMRSKLKKALKVSGFSTKLPLDHCFKTLEGPDSTWEEIETLGIDFHQALLLYNKSVLSWQPEITNHVNALQLAELKFLFGLYFKTKLPEDLILTMLGQLKTPYYYSHDCIYWDFYTVRWKYFVPQNETKHIHNPEARYEDGMADNKFANKFSNDFQKYERDKVYKVALTHDLNPTFILAPQNSNTNSITLKDGDLIKFKL
jgi:hypothetical protein